MVFYRGRKSSSSDRCLWATAILVLGSCHSLVTYGSGMQRSSIGLEQLLSGDSVGKTRRIAMAEKDIEIATLEVKKRNAEMLPALTTNASYTLNSHPAFATLEKDSIMSGVPPKDDNIPIDGKRSLNAQLELTWPLYRGGQLVHAHRAALDRESMAKIELQAETLALRRDLANSYLEMFYCQSSLSSHLEIIQFFQKQLEKSTYLLEQRAIFHLDMQLAQAKLKEATSNLLEQKAACLKSIERFNQLTGSNVILTNGFQLSLRFEEWGQAVLASPKESDWLPLVVNNNSTLKERHLDVTMSENLAKSKRGEALFPKVDLKGFYEYQNSDLNKGGPRTNPGAMITVSFPLFAWGRDYYDYQKAVAETSKKALSEYQEMDRLKNEVVYLIAIIGSLKSSIEAHESLARFQQEQVQIFSKRKGLSDKTELDLLEKKVDLTRTNIKVKHLWTDYWSKVLELYYMAGKDPVEIFSVKARELP